MLLHRIETRGRGLRAAVAAATLLAGLSARGAQAAPVIKAGFYSEGSGGACTYDCTASFTAVPAASTLIVTYVSCFIQTKNGAGTPLAQLHSGGASPSIWLAPQFLSSSTSGGVTLREFAIASQVLMIVPGGKVPRLTVYATGAGASVAILGCTISGQLK